MAYYPRIADRVLAKNIESSGAVLVEGTKACGKTETALRISKSVTRFDTDADVAIKMDIDPFLVLQGETPRLLDEWQLFPRIWDFTRREVDDRKQKGQFVLTGSATPDEKSRRHSGAGRFSVLKMRPMSWFERGWASGEVSLLSLFEGVAPCSREVEFSIPTLCDRIALGGWPGLIGEHADAAFEFTTSYVNLIAEVDVHRVSGRQRNPTKVLRFIRSLARNISTEASLHAIASDAAGSDDTLDDDTARAYLQALERLMVSENLPAWNPHIRSSTALRKSPKRHLCDPSLVLGALGMTAGKLAFDLPFLCMLFESLVIRDLRVYAWAWGGFVSHYRDATGHEVDAIVEYPDGRWGAFEVKIGVGAVDEAARNLLVLAEKIDTARTPPPSTLCVITGNGFAHRRKDGVCVIPLATLGP
jgi:predicted AAA+ superfamily ATPase